MLPYPHFADKGTEAQKGKQLAQDSTAGEWPSRDYGSFSMWPWVKGL